MKKGGIVHLVGENKKPKSKTKNRFRPYQHGAQIERLKLPITCDNDQRNGGRIVTYKELNQASASKYSQKSLMLRAPSSFFFKIINY